MRARRGLGLLGEVGNELRHHAADGRRVHLPPGRGVGRLRRDRHQLDEAKRNGARLPVTALVDQFYGDVQQMGGKRWDTSSLIKRLK